MAQTVVSSCINYMWKYDVFLSFHGEDTRLGFVGFLRESLHQRGIHVFYDDNSIRTGDEITPVLLKAIQESRIAIIVFSENYANSTFCLQELEMILECFKEEGRLVYPVFYYVDPLELRRPRGSYAKALVQLEERFKDNKQRVEKWRLALSQAANLKGCHLKFKIANEQEYSTTIINKVLATISHTRNPLHVTHYPVGLVSRVKEVVSLLDLWSPEGNKMVGIVGAGGIGKSTIARAVYNSIADNFEGLCFLSNIRENSKKPNGLAHLQEKLLCKLVMEKDLQLGDFHEGIPIIKHRLGHKKILLIIDDVDELQQLRALAGSCYWFGPGSRIVITTRNKQLLASHDIKNIYNVRELNDEESLQLLSWYAFKTENVEPDFIEVSKRAIHYACGFPLALEVIGSDLRGKRLIEWNFALDQFERIPEGKILRVLRLSYDSLEEFQKRIFLDLACFSKGEELGEIKDMLLCLHGIPSEHAIRVLIDKSLIKVEGDRVLMHDLIEDMGKEIVRQELPNEPAKRSRLWFYKDIIHVLKQNKGTDDVEVIVLDLPEDLSEGRNSQIQWSGKAFMKMKNLKMLVIKNATFFKCPVYLPRSLRWLKWKGYPFKFLPYNIFSTELICLDLSCGHFDALQPFTREFQNLSRMNFRSCKFLRQIPDLSGVSNLRELWLDGCTNLFEIHRSVGCLNKLKELSAMRCNNLEILPPKLWLTSLEHLNLFGCSNLYVFPDILVEMKYMQTLDLGRTAITVLPSSIHNLIGLETLNMEECPNLEKLPTAIFLLPNLWEVNANFSKGLRHFKMCEGGLEAKLDCYALSLKLKHFCFSNCNISDDSLACCLSYFTNMIRLDLSFNNFTTLPACIRECHHMRYLLLDHSKRLQHIEEMPPNLEKFSAICCMSLTKSSKSKVLYQALNQQTGKGNFILPGEDFPENLDNYSTRSCVSFWVHDVFPTIFLWILVKDDQDFLSNCTFFVHVNDTKLDILSQWLLFSTMKMGHLYICDLQSMIHKAELPQGHRWNHVRVSIKSNTQEIQSGRDPFHLGLHVCKQQNNSETIRFMDPRTRYTDWEELEDDNPYQGLPPSVFSLRAQLLPMEEEELKAKREVLPSRWTYDVFFSYVGDSECSSFISHLHNHMCKRGIYAFFNNELVKTSGKELKAIQQSRTAIIFISKNYVSSPSCLDSLATILECCRIECRFFYPLIYDVEPLELQYQTGSYGEVFTRLEKIFQHNKERVQKWRLALSEAVGNSRDINSYIYPKNATKEENAIELITNKVSPRTAIFPFNIEDFSVPILDESRVQEFISLLDVKSNGEVKMVGICGSGIRRSAITFAVCNFIARHFEDLWYFCGVREIARGYDSTWHDFRNWITQPWFPQRKILVILDYVEELDQLRTIREIDRFGEGSRIIVATSNKQLLEIHGIKIILDEIEKATSEVSRLKAQQALLPSKWIYDVFLSYRGDYEYSSFVSHLYNSFCQRGLHAVDNDELVKISGEELEAIKESRAAIVVISKNYASSPSCLDSLATILECCRIECRFFYPIIYDVEPLELQYQTGSYGEVFTRLEKIFQHNKERVQKWRLALSEAVGNSRDINSYIYPNLVRNATEEQNAIELITNKVSPRIRVFSFYNEWLFRPIWDESCVHEFQEFQEFISLLDVESNGEVKMVGICGTILYGLKMVHVVCNSSARHFEDLWCFCGVREIARGYDSTWHDFLNWITQPWFPQRKILVILDNVRKLDQFRTVIEIVRFGEGSMCIVVTEDEHDLIRNGIEIIIKTTFGKTQLIKIKEKEGTDSLDTQMINTNPRERQKTLTAKRCKLRERITGCFKGERSNYNN